MERFPYILDEVGYVFKEFSEEELLLLFHLDAPYLRVPSTSEPLKSRCYPAYIVFNVRGGRYISEAELVLRKLPCVEEVVF